MWNEGWDKLFASKDWGRYPSIEVVSFVARHFYSAQDSAAVRILEVGPATGANVWFLAREGFETHAIDGSKVAIDKCTKMLEKEGLQANLKVGDIAQLPWDDSFFDCVIDCECLYANNYADSRKAVGEIHRVLKPGGRLLSITFGLGMQDGFEHEALPDEPHTFKKLRSPWFNEGYGLIRLTSEDEIPDLYQPFGIESVDLAQVTASNQTANKREWIIKCLKKT